MENDHQLSRDELWLKKLDDAIKDNFPNEKFGVAELSDAVAISRFQLHRKLKTLRGKSVSQYIRDMRLEAARKMLIGDVATAAEIAYRVGFSSPSYFNKCFHDRYGYPPGEARKRSNEPSADSPADPRPTEPVLQPEGPQPNRYGSWPKRRDSFLLFVTAALAGLASFYLLVPTKTQQVSIAILPLANLTGSPEEAYFVEGMHDALIGELGQISALRVISRTSTLRYPGSNMLLQDIARELDVDLIVEGSVFGKGDSMRIQLQLIDVFPQERHLWAKEYHEDVRRALTVHSTIAGDIAEEIHASLTSDEAQRMAQSRLVHPDMYRAYLRGMFYLNQADRKDVEKGINYLHDAVKIDPADPLPWAGLAIAYSTIGHGAASVPDAFTRADAAARRALELDSSLAEAHLAIAMIALYKDWDWERARKGFKTTLAINPNLAEAHAHYAWLEMLFGRNESVLIHGKKATELDPFSSLYASYLSCEYWWLSRPELALQEAERAVKLEPKNSLALYVKGGVYAASGRHGEAITTANAAAGINRQFKWIMGITYSMANDVVKARHIAEELKTDTRPIETWGLAEIYAILGDRDEAFHWLEKCYQVRFSWIPWVEWNPNYQSLVHDSRFHNLLRKMNLPSSRQNADKSTGVTTE